MKGMQATAMKMVSGSKGARSAPLNGLAMPKGSTKPASGQVAAGNALTKKTMGKAAC